MLTSATWGLNREAWAILLGARTRTKCPEGNLRELMWDSNPNCGIDRERGKKERERENFPTKTPNLRHCLAHRTKDWANTRGELAGSEPAHPPQEAGTQAGSIESQKGANSPRDGILHQTVSWLPVANQAFRGSWTDDILWEGYSQRSAPEKFLDIFLLLSFFLIFFIFHLKKF